MARNSTTVRVWRYTFLVVLTGAVVLLYFYYDHLKTRKNALIKLAFVYPYDDDFFSHAHETFVIFSSWNKDGFFQEQGVYRPLIEAMTRLQRIHDKLKRNVGGPDTVLWLYERSSIDLYEEKANIPKEDIDSLEYAAFDYIRKFDPVLQIRRWKASREEPGKLVVDSILIETKTVEDALVNFQKIFHRKGVINLEGAEFHLHDVTRYELFVILEQLQWHRHKAEDEYIELVEEQRRKWLREVADKFNMYYP